VLRFGHSLGSHFFRSRCSLSGTGLAWASSVSFASDKG
jgi:hypothetical protein